MDSLVDCLYDISKLNIIYTIILLASAASNIRLNDPLAFILSIMMNYNTSLSGGSMSPDAAIGYTSAEEIKSCLLIRMAKRLALISDNLILYLQSQFNEHTATSIASFSVLIIVLSIICCFIISLMREEERKIKEQYKKLNGGSSQSFIAFNGHSNSSNNDHSGGNGGGHGIFSSSFNQHQKKGHHYHQLGQTFITSSSGQHNHHHQSANPAGHSVSSVNRSGSHKLHVIELRRETYFGLVRLLKPGCRTIVLLCDAQSKLKLLTKFYQCIYPYRRNKSIQFAFLLIEKNIGWYKDLLKLALNEKRDLHINPINCIGTVLALNGFKKYFSVYHASDSRCDPDEPFILLEESLLDNLSGWLERLFAGKASRYYVKYWPDQMR